MDGIFKGFTDALSPKGIGMILAVLVVLVLLEKFNYAPGDLAARF